ncbi:drug resistance transporter, EmrB/QacA subfamily [Sinosporangium album]|uniref:Drug resistance transporter, EmrB/QacA subfamily n=1 Tax=Sinosporangium album TaxID=504805 RepID=A0A1G8I3L9_9ACTN|nr:MFS transporter [Sinosporangium album]SDI13432.1 drug resistance transporter, EmrB/QacA subfamily [Sinosporangium album]
MGITADSSQRARRVVPRGLAMAGLGTAAGVVILDASMVNLATPAMRTALNLSTTELSWVVDGYLIAFAGLLLLGGRLADVLGGRRVFLSGVAIYVVASAACALALDATTLIAARIFQGAGAAVVTPAALSLMLGLYPGAGERRRALGMWGGVAGAGSLLGVALGGVVTQTMGWPAIFWLPVPIEIITAVVVWYAVPPSPARPGRFDLSGAAAITVGISALALGLISAPEVGWGSARTMASLAVGAVSLGAFIVAELRSDQPLVPLGVFRRVPVVIANTVMLLLGAVSVGLFYFLSQYLQHVLGMSPTTAGLSQLPIAVLITLGGFAAPWTARLVGFRSAMAGALVALSAGLFWLAQSDATSEFVPSLLGPFLLIGAGLGLGFVYATTIAVSGAAMGETGLVSGLINATRQLGGALGLAALIAVAAASGPEAAAGAGDGIAYTNAFLGAAVLALTAAVLSLAPAAHREPASGERDRSDRGSGRRPTVPR